MSGREIFVAAVPELLAAARAKDPRIGILTRQAMRELHPYECPEKMTLQIVRLVKSSQEFIRDDDNLAFSRKQATR